MDSSLTSSCLSTGMPRVLIHKQPLFSFVYLGSKWFPGNIRGTQQASPPYVQYNTLRVSPKWRSHTPYFMVTSDITRAVISLWVPSWGQRNSYYNFEIRLNVEEPVCYSIPHIRPHISWLPVTSQVLSYLCGFPAEAKEIVTIILR